VPVDAEHHRMITPDALDRIGRVLAEMASPMSSRVDAV
jgi:hypothetical protein